jgi:AcrR family transcriptional regulator
MTSGQVPSRGDRSRQAILEAAVEVFAARGYRGASLASVAQAVGMTQAGLLHHYPSKEHLLVAVLNEHYHADGNLVGAAIARGGVDLLDGLCSLMEHNTQHRRQVQLFSVLVAESIAPDHPGHEYVVSRYDRVRNRLVGSLAAGVSRGEVGPDVDIDALVVLLIAAMDGLQSQWLLDSRVDMVRSFRLLADLVRTYLADGVGETSAAS